MRHAFSLASSSNDTVLGSRCYYGTSRTRVTDGSSALGERRAGCSPSQYPRPWAEPAADDTLPLGSVSPALLRLGASDGHLTQHYIRQCKRKLTCVHSPADSLSLHPYFEPCSRFFFSTGSVHGGLLSGFISRGRERDVSSCSGK